jgi:hypothetical protein
MRAGIFVVAGLIPGFPGDSRQAFLHSVEQVRKLQAEFPGRLRVNTEVFRVSPGLPLFRNLEGVGLTPRVWAEDYLNIAPRYLDITGKMYCSVEGSNQGMERIGRERIAFMIRTDAPVRTDKFTYDEDEQLAVNEFEFRHVFGEWYLAATKSEAARIYALLVDGEELTQLRELTGRDRARYLRKLESLHIAFPSLERPAVLQTGFVRQFPDEPVTVAVSPFVVIRSIGREILAVNYVNGRSMRRPLGERSLLKSLAQKPLTVPTSKKVLRQKLEKLQRFGIIAAQAAQRPFLRMNH